MIRMYNGLNETSLYILGSTETGIGPALAQSPLPGPVHVSPGCAIQSVDWDSTAVSPV